MTKRFDGAILTLTGYFNYGNVLQRYALQKYLRNNGLNFISYMDTLSSPRDIYEYDSVLRLKTPVRALKRYFNNQKPYWHLPSFAELYPEAFHTQNLINFVNENIEIKRFDPNDTYENYIVGSDQIWRSWWGDKEKLGYYFLNFLNNEATNRISYAASFGMDKIQDVMTPQEVTYIKPYIERFDHISVRETSGVKIIEDSWSIEQVAEVVDPTLLLDADEYSRIINKSETKYAQIQPIFSYVLGETVEVRKFIRSIQDDRRQAVTKILAHGDTESSKLPPVELWLKGFRDAELAITNSFHGMMFSIINSTDFIVIGRKVGGISRITDFLTIYGLQDRFVDEQELTQFNPNNLKPIDWGKVNKTLQQKRAESERWLLGSIVGSRRK